MLGTRQACNELCSQFPGRKFAKGVVKYKNCTGSLSRHRIYIGFTFQKAVPVSLQFMVICSINESDSLASDASPSKWDLVTHLNRKFKNNDNIDHMTFWFISRSVQVAEISLRLYEQSRSEICNKLYGRSFLHHKYSESSNKHGNLGLLN